MVSARSKLYALPRSLLLILLAACSRTRSAVPNPIPEIKTALPSISKTDGWLPQQRSIIQRYLLFDSSTVEVSNDSTAKVIPVVSTVFYSITINSSGGRDILGTITSVLDSSKINSSIPRRNFDDSTHHQNFNASLTRTNQIVGPESKASPSCSGNNTLIATRLFELIPSYPQHAVKAGDKWSDTVRSISYHGKILMKQQVFRQYELLDFTQWEGRDVVKISQHLTMIFTTLAKETNNSLSAAGAGSSAAILYLARENGLLLNSDSHSHSELIITTSRGTFPFIQNTVTHITAQ